MTGNDWKGKFDSLEVEGVKVVYLTRNLEISSSQIKHDLYDAASVEEHKTSHDEINTDPKRHMIVFCQNQKDPKKSIIFSLHGL